MDKKCKHCFMMIPKEAKICPHCRKTQGWTVATKIVWVVITLIIVAVIFSESDKQNIPNTPQKQDISADSMFQKMTASEHLAEAKKALDEWEPNKDPMKASWGRVDDAKKHLLAIHQGEPESSEKDKLMQEVNRREKEIQKIAKVVAQKIIMRQQRKEFAKKYELALLDEGMDTTVSTHGKDDTTLKIKWALMSRPLVHKLINDSSATSNLQKLGFKKLIFTDGYDSTWSYEFH